MQRQRTKIRHHRKQAEHGIEPEIERVNDPIADWCTAQGIGLSMGRKMVRHGIPVHIGEGRFENVKLPVLYIGTKCLVPRDSGAAFMARLRNAPPRPVSAEPPPETERAQATHHTSRAPGVTNDAPLH